MAVTDVLGRDEFDTLAAAKEFPSVSIYLPTDRAGIAVEQGPTRFRNLLTAAVGGRVDTLLVRRHDRCWAPAANATADTIHEDRQPGDIDPVDAIARTVLAAGGDIVLINDDDLPDVDHVAALLRYA